MPTFGTASARQLATCDERLQRVFQRVVEAWDCTVLEGKRSEAQQRINVARGVSRTMDSKHVYPLGAPSMAVDVAPYPVKWHEPDRFYFFAGFVLGVAHEMHVPLRYGGDWNGDHELSDERFLDLVHFELTGP